MPLRFLVFATSISPIVLFCVSTPAFAEADCTQAKQLLSVIKTFEQADAKYTNIIQPTFTIKLRAIGDNPQPDGVRYMHEGEAVDLPLGEDGEVLELEKALAFHKDGKLCKLVNGQLVEDKKEPTGEASLNFTFPFKDITGRHSRDDLLEGAKDGSKVMNGLAPGGLGFAVPGLKAIITRPAEEQGDMPVLTFWRDGARVEGPKITRVGKTQFFKTKALKKSKADEVRVEGSYMMNASFNYKEEDLAEAEAARLKALADTPAP